MTTSKLDTFLHEFYGLEIIIFGLSFLFCLLPKAIKTVDRLARIFPILTLASAGFLLAVLLLDFIPHMFPHDHGHVHTKGESQNKEANGHIHQHNHDHKEHDHKDHDHKDHDHKDHDHKKDNASDHTHTSGCCNHDHAHDNHEQCHGNKNTVAGMICAGLALLSLIAIDQCIIKHDHCEEEKHEHKHADDCKEEGIMKTTSLNTHSIDLSNKVITHSHDKKDDIGCCNTKMLQNTDSKTKALIYIAAISIHSFFEGLGMKKQAFGTYEFGIILHKILESFAIGMTLFNSAFSFNVCLLMNVFYSVLTPLGMYISRSFSGDYFKINGIPISFIFNGLALGSLMFIVFLEMIPGAFHKAGNKTWKMLGLILGFVLSSILITQTPHCH